MRDDADLRARIEARVAARRTRSADTASFPANGAEPGRRFGRRRRADGQVDETPTDDPSPEPSEDVPSGDTQEGHRPESVDERPRPRPRPQPGPGRPRPGPTLTKDTAGTADVTAASATPPESADDAAETKAEGKSPDISRFLAASERQPGDEKREPTRAGRSVRRTVRVVLRIAVIVGIALGAAVLLRTYVVAPYYIPSGSMEPTLHGCTGCDDDHVLVDKISYRFHEPQESDIVVFSKPPKANTPDKVLIKRVIGLPGDRVALEHGKVYINGKPIQEPYIRKACGPHPTQPEDGRSRWHVPNGDIFVMGDNRCNSMDSRDFGPIRESSVIGRAFAIIWPLGRIRLL